MTRKNDRLRYGITGKRIISMIKLEKKRLLLIHFSVWLAVILFPIFPSIMLKSKIDEINLTMHFFDILFKIIIFYINSFFLFRFLLNKSFKKYFLFSASLVLFISLLLFPVIGIMVIQRFDNELVAIKNELVAQQPYKLFLVLFSNVLILGVSSGISLIIKTQQDEKMANDARHIQISTELDFLKNQIHPHFFFNTLNNIHFLIETDAHKAQKSVIEMSKLMRYLLYETSNCYMSLKKEIEFTNHFISLMKMRISEDVVINFDYPKYTENVLVPPLLLLTLVENAFKHCNATDKDAFINLKIATNNNQVIFETKNTKKKNTEETESGGLGLHNLKQRLNILYPDNYHFTINETSTEFYIHLILNTKNKDNDKIAMYHTGG